MPKFTKSPLQHDFFYKTKANGPNNQSKNYPEGLHKSIKARNIQPGNQQMNVVGAFVSDHRF
jgi:hypothetical protein